MAAKRKPLRKTSARRKTDAVEALRLLSALRADLKSFEATHPHLIQAADELARRLAALGI